MSIMGRVLIIDDDESWREGIAEILTKSKFHADTASSIEQAREKLSESLYHLLILDIQFNNTSDGMNFLQEMQTLGLIDAIKIVMLSAYGTPEQMRQAFKAYSVSDFIPKAPFDSQAFLKSIMDIFANDLKINLDLEIHWDPPQSVEQVLLNLRIDGERIRRTSPLSNRIAQELDDLLCRLFFKSTSIIVKRLSPGYSGAGVLQIRPFSIRGGGRAVVVKFGDFLKIGVEQQNFVEYVRPFIGGGRCTTIHDVRRTPLLAGIVYSLLGTSNERLESFNDFYHRAGIDSICVALDGLFHNTCQAWYANLGHLQPYNLTADYQHLLGFTTELLEECFPQELVSMQSTQKLSFKALSNGRTFTHPLHIAANRTFVKPTYVCTTHGDINQHNLLVDEAKHTWLIDFQDTGQGHALRDIAMLDSVVRYQLLAAEEASLTERLAMEDILCSIENFSQLDGLVHAFVTDNVILAKAYAVTVHLRLLARKIVVQNHTEGDLSEYYIALFYNALNVQRFSTLSTVQREHALLSSCLIADKIV